MTEVKQLNSFQEALENKIPNKYLSKLKEHDFQVSIRSTDGTQMKLELYKENFAGTGLYSIAFKKDGLLYKLFFPKDSDLKYSEVLSNEAVLQKKISHPNIANLDSLVLVDIGELQVPCLIREDVPTSLDEKITNKNLTLEESMELVEELSSATQYVFNETGEIITDLTIENIRQKNNGDWVICDLGGTAKQGSEKKVSIDAIFTAPEVLESDPNNSASERSMVYSISLILWSVLTGKEIDRMDLAFSNIQELVTQETIPPEIYKIIINGLSENPEDRSKNPISLYKELKSAYDQHLLSGTV